MKIVSDLSVTSWRPSPYRAYLPPGGTPTPSLIADFANGFYALSSKRGNYASIFTHTRAGNASCFDANGILQVYGADQPRIDHDPATGQVLGLLVEGPATNHLLHSAAFSAASWSAISLGSGVPPTVTADQGSAPDGSQTADRVQIVLNGGVSSLDRSLVRQTLAPIATSTTFTASVWIKSHDGSSYNVGLSINGAGKTIATAAAVWQRFSVTAQLADGYAPELWIGQLGHWGASDNADILIWGAQLEKNDFATSYIATEATPVTRAADHVVVPIGPWLRTDQGTLLVEARWEGGTHINSGNRAAVSLGSSGNWILAYNNSGDVGFLSQTPGGESASFAFGLADGDRDFHRLGLAFAANDFAASSDGAAVQTDTLVDIPAISGGAMTVGAMPGFGAVFNGHIKQLIHYPIRLSDPVIQALTA